MRAFRPVLYILGLLLCGLGVFMLVPMAADLVAANGDWKVFAASAAASVFAGVQLVFTNRQRSMGQFGVRQAFLLTTLSWALLTAFAALPFLFFGGGLSYAEAYFEAMSGLTTTGATVIVGLDAAPPGILLWRALLQGIGGIGIVVVAILILPLLRIGGMQLFRAESSDKSEKTVARSIELVRYLIVIYVTLIASCALAYWIGGMTAFEAVCHALTTVATGGFSTSDASFAHFDSPGLEWVAVVFMLAGALPFIAYVNTVRRVGNPLWRDSQSRVYVASLIVVAAVFALSIASSLGLPLSEALRIAVFNTVSIATTTGYTTVDYAEWGGFVGTIILLLTLFGGCTGSTAGGIKVFRHQIMWGAAKSYLTHLVSPNLVTVQRYDGRVVSDEIVRSVLVFLVIYVGALVATALGLAAFGLDIVTSFSGAATALGNVGPGLGEIIGPAGTYASLHDGAKWLLAAAMLLGRLELFSVLVLFNRQFWRW